MKHGKKWRPVPVTGVHITRTSKARAPAKAARQQPSALTVRFDPAEQTRGGRRVVGKRRTLSPDQARRLRGRLKALGFEDYGAYRRASWWQRFSTSIATPYRNCFVCGRTGSDLHHLDYATLGREQPDDVVPLCDEHHVATHHVHGVERRPLVSAHLVVRDRYVASGGVTRAPSLRPAPPAA